ncbi:MAG: FAD-dependent oxidoreductase [Chloroflexi bacterium]|nr:FAD-dependent oxidoreductase [Chloroflexota bacterium]
MSTHVELLVVGLGVMGAATLQAAAPHARSIVGFEQFSAGHTRGSSHGASRALNLFYPDEYLGLALRARERWLVIQERSADRLFYPCGMLVWDLPNDPDFRATLAAFERTGFPHAVLSPVEVTRQFPILETPAESAACWMPTAGFLDADRCVDNLLQQARADGATVHFNQKVIEIDLDRDTPRVISPTEVYDCERLVITAGPWAPELLRACGWPMVVTRQNVFNFRPGAPERYTTDVLPVLGDRITHEYCFPLHAGSIKVADSALGPPTDPNQVPSHLPEEESDALSAWLHRVLPGLSAQALGGISCLYTVTPDLGFILGRHPAHAAVVIGAGFSGRGFKFAPEVGRLLAEMALMDYDPPAFMSPARFAQHTQALS